MKVFNIGGIGINTHPLTLDQVKILSAEYAKLEHINLLIQGEISNILLMPFGTVIRLNNLGFHLMGYTQDDRDIKETLEIFNN